MLTSRRLTVGGERNGEWAQNTETNEEVLRSTSGMKKGRVMEGKNTGWRDERESQINEERAGVS